MKYISSDIVINELKDKLSTWFDGNHVDDSILYPRIEHCLSKISLDNHPEKFTVLEIEQGKAKLPSDFKQLCLALSCMPRVKENELSRFNEVINTEERHVCELNLCESSCDVCHDECGNMYQMVQTFNRYPEKIVWDTFDVLCIGKDTKPLCSDDCFNFRSKSPNHIEIKNGYLHTNFDDGLVYIEYVAKLEDGVHFLIPDHPTIKEWIKADMIHEVFQTIYYNGMDDVLQRYRDTATQLHIKKQNALVIIKRKEVQDFYKLANTITARYAAMSNLLWNNSVYCPGLSNHKHSGESLRRPKQSSCECKKSSCPLCTNRY